MANPRFYLFKTVRMRNRINANPEIEHDRDFKLPIYLSFPLNPNRFRISTGIWIKPSHWDEKRQEANRNFPNRAELREDLEAFLNKTKSAYNKIKASGNKPTQELMRQMIETEAEVPVKEIHFFWPDVETYLQAEKIMVTHSTWKKINAIINLLKDFQTDAKYKFDYGSINDEFYQKFIEYSVTQKQHVNNTIGKSIKGIKRFLNYGLDKGWHTCMEHQKAYFTAPRESIEVITLLPEEIKAFLEYKAVTKRHRKAVDMFVFACLTGLRISDILRLEPSHIIGNEIHLTTLKNRKSIRIPLTQISKEIIKRHEGNPLRVFPPITQQKAREYLKEAALEMGLTREIIKVRHQLGNRIEKRERLCDLIGYHHAKRTAVSLMLQNGADRETVQHITGNNSDTIERYIRIENEYVRTQYLASMDNALAKIQKQKPKKAIKR